ncbi:MAG TPA: MotA/TolQ/ExbB proton channel family protein [Thermoguttaceae bacterium]
MKALISMNRIVTGWLLLAILAAVWLSQYSSWAKGEEDGSSPTVSSPDSATPSSDMLETASIPTRDVNRILSDGGPLIYAIVLCSFLLVTFLLERSINLRRSRVIPKPFVTRFLYQLQEGQLDRQQALQLCEENGSPVAQVFAGAVRKWGRPSVEVEQGVIDSGERVTNGLRRYLRVFYAVATVGPLLGLLGTVLGMIQTFNVIAAADAQGRPEMLAGGIAKALLNTVGGLAVAIPASIIYVFFVSRVDRLVIDIDEFAQEVANAISAEELSDREKKISGSRTRRISKSEAA